MGRTNRSLDDSVVTCMHFVIGGAVQLRVGQRRGCKCAYKSGHVDLIVVHEGEFVVTN